MGAGVNGRTLIVSILAVAAALLIVRDAYVQAYADSAPQTAAAVWATHPRVLVSQALTEIGEAAVAGKEPPAESLARLTRVAKLSPLSHDPFLVRGISAQQAGDLPLAEQAFLAARHRAPREAAPRYFLAQLYLTSGRGEQGLSELAVLARLLPHGPQNVAPSLASYARSAADLTSLKSIFRKHPELEDAVLAELAKDPANAALALRLATRLRATDGSLPNWSRTMIARLAEAGEFAAAYGLWEAVTSARSRGALFDPNFAGSDAPEPFNWTLRSDSTGSAEPNGRGGLSVIFYGREDSVLASQSTLLEPGRYRLAMRVSGNPAGSLRWIVRCLPGATEALALPLGDKANANAAADFTVGQECTAQRLDLVGVAGELPKQVEVTISELDLTGGPNAG